MFDIIASRYDDFTRTFSFGMDATWKAELLAALRGHVRPDAVALDIACGTGDLAFAVAELAPDGRVLGIDASQNMIEKARARAGARTGSGTPAFDVGDMASLPARDATVDLVTGGYALRNAPDWRAALTECARVLKPGGLLVTLDFYRPANPVWRAAFLTYLRAAGELVGYLWHGHGVVYGYIAPSIAHFCTAAEYEAALAAAGFRVEHRAIKLGGGVALHVARRSR
jgi:demethylmenaquinone methyltransferase/2-methoxy-6-polyprenyl-1,4-benzoquinol methylase